MALVTTPTALPDRTPTLILAPDGSRLDAVVTNTGTTRVYLGSDSTVSDRNALIELRVGEPWRFHDCTASLYAYSVSFQGTTAGQVSVLVTNPE